MKLLENVIDNPRFKKCECLGDIILVEKVTMYIEGRNKLLTSKNINKTRVLIYEQKLIKDDWKAWWHHYSKSYIKTVLWFLKRLTVNLNLQQEFALLKSFHNRLPLTTQKIGLYGMDNLSKDKELADYFIEGCIKIK